ncbi:MAG TPA: acetylornithine deacetylase [Thermoanaerobaculia bacterium]|nr:acetylornithine deacetylase [Thermoanaerobaculia bacterium]
MPTVLSDAELLARLVGFDSTSRNSNLPIADFLCDYLDRPGVRIARNVLAGDAGQAEQGEGAAAARSQARDKVNVIAWLGPEADGDRHGLVLSGHTDVVPADEEGWESDPFQLADRGDRYVGRGACDMKGFLAVAANLSRAGAAAARLRHPLALVFTFDEEVGGLGARHLLDSFPAARELPRNAVFGEPTSLRVARAHKGHLKLRITFVGRSAHSGYPHLGRNAIEPAGEVIRALARIRRELEEETAPHCELFPEVPYVPLNIGTVRGGAAINVVPDRCAVEVGVRPLPGADSAALLERLRQAVLAAAAGWEPEIELLSDSPPLLLDENAPVHRYLCALVGQREGASVSFATDAGWLQRLGLDCVIFGPGSIEAAHRPNEWLAKSELAAAHDLLGRTIRHFCAEPG